MDDAQPLEHERAVDEVDALGLLRDRGRKPAGADDQARPVDLRADSSQHALDQAHVAVDEPRLDRADGVATDDALGPLDVDARELGRAREQGVGADVLVAVGGSRLFAMPLDLLVFANALVMMVFGARCSVFGFSVRESSALSALDFH